MNKVGITLFTRTLNPDTRMYDWQCKYFENVNFTEDVKVSVSGKGLRSQSLIKVRIPTENSIKIQNGDRLVRGKIIADSPPNGAYTVVGFADNRRGSLKVRHWKVICQ